MSQMGEVDDRDGDVVDLEHPPFRVTLFELDSGDGGEDLNSNGRQPHSDDVIRGEEQFWG